MTTIELEPVIHQEPNEDDHNHEERFCHLYTFGESVAHCGIPASADWHNGLGHRAWWEKGVMACPTCGAPICMDCLLKVS